MSRIRGSTFLPNSSSERMSGSRSFDPGGCSEMSMTPAPTTSRQRRTCSTTVSGLPMNVVGAGVLDLSLHPPGSASLDPLLRALELFGKKVLPRIRDI